MFVFVDKYEQEGLMAHILRFLVLFVSWVAIPHKLQPYGLKLAAILADTSCMQDLG
jgi:hypothetical protein